MEEEHKLRMFETRLLCKICGPDRNGVIGDCIMESFIICTTHWRLFRWSNQEGWGGHGIRQEWRL